MPGEDEDLADTELVLVTGWRVKQECPAASQERRLGRTRHCDAIKIAAQERRLERRMRGEP